MKGGDAPYRAGSRAHHEGFRLDAVRARPNALEQRAPGDAGGGHEDVVARDEIVCGENPIEVESGSNERWKFFRDVLVFQFKMLLDNVRDFALMPVSLVAALMVMALLLTIARRRTGRTAIRAGRIAPARAPPLSFACS